MKKLFISLLFLSAISDCIVSKKVQSKNVYKGIIFYSENSPFLTFYPTENNKLTNRQIVELLDNSYGNHLWLSESKYRFALEDVLMQFDSIRYEYNARLSINRYTYVTTMLNRPITSKLVDSIYRTKPYKYLDLSFDQFIIDDREIKLDSLIFSDNKLNREYLKLTEKHKNSIKATDPPSSH